MLLYQVSRPRYIVGEPKGGGDTLFKNHRTLKTFEIFTQFFITAIFARACPPALHIRVSLPVTVRAECGDADTVQAAVHSSRGYQGQPASEGAAHHTASLHCRYEKAE